MREHQIVITLKPDQFLEVQRLARAANAKSMGAFVRQKLLAALGIEGSLESPQSGASDVDLEALLQDLQRLHGELKSFVAESLSPYAPEAFAASEGDLDEEALVAQAVAAVQSTCTEDELEAVAQKIFAISPRLGPIGDFEGTVLTDDKPSTLPQSRDAQVQTGTETNQAQEQAPDAIPAVPLTGVAGAAEQLLSRHEMHYRRDIHRTHHGSADDRIAANHQSSAAHQPTPAPTNKDSLADPLARLLGADELDKPANKPQSPVPISDDDDAFDVPLSIAERRRMIAEAQAASAGGKDNALAPSSAVSRDMPAAVHDTFDGREDLNSSSQHAAVSADPAVVAASGADAAQMDSNAADSSTLPSSSSASPSTSANGSASASRSADSAGSASNEPGLPLGYPPISGNPPPKRRQV